VAHESLQKSAPVLCRTHLSGAISRRTQIIYAQKRHRPQTTRTKVESSFIKPVWIELVFVEGCFMGIRREKGSWATNQSGEL
jgi:hypothetical protein